EAAGHRLKAKTLKVYTAITNTTRAYEPCDDWILHEKEDGTLEILFRIPVKGRFIKLHCHFNDLDEEENPTDVSTVRNSKEKIIKVCYLVDWRQESYTYDETGNRLASTITLEEKEEAVYTYYENSDRLKTDATYGYTYDANGNLTAKGKLFTIVGEELIFDNDEGEYREYEYDVLNRLIAVRQSESGTDNVSLVATYTYDALNRRIKTESTELGTTWYAFGTDGNVLLKETEEAYEQYIYVAGKMFILVTGNNEGSDEKTYYYITNHLGTTEMVTDESGQVVWQNELTPFGESSGEIGIMHLQSKFTGKDRDEETGLYYFNARWYDAETGRFISVDPVKDGVNWYAYCANNPLVMIDPTGLLTEEQEEEAKKAGKKTQREIQINARKAGSTYDLGFEISDQEFAAFYMFFQGMQYEYSALYELRAQIVDSVGYDYSKLSLEQKDLILEINNHIEKLEVYESAVYSKGYKRVTEATNLAAFTNFIPVFGTGQRIWEVFSGRQLWSGYKYTVEERIFKGVFLAAELAAIGYGVYNAVKSYMPQNVKVDVGRNGNWPAINRTGNPTGNSTGVGQKLLPAPKQIDAVWGVSNYRHGGLMNTMEHIWYRHSPNSGFENVSRYAQGTTVRNIMGYVDNALRYGDVTQTGTNAFMIEYNLSMTIGSNIAGDAASSIRVFVRNGIIQTAFPF
ncbi:MAG: RHS domain-containing protein, partial [Bacteroidales bacterium]|nr:RHS domain-containing protein [Bacteroidales bacterium]